MKMIFIVSLTIILAKNEKRRFRTVGDGTGTEEEGTRAESEFPLKLLSDIT
jgi:hypothetical protein